MCGIAGKIYFDNSEIKESDILKMTNAIAHRGPDDEGVFISKNKKVGLGNRRLSILDLSKKGHMPMHFLNRYVITYNGEIYNFQESKRKLIKLGYKFKSNSDTEVILALYDKYKEKCLNYLRGMFSFALFDSKENKIFFAVGRLGKKPLKYYRDGNNFIFASEIKAILTQKEVKTAPDMVAIHHYLTYGYINSPRTGFEKIYKLQPGHCMTLDLKTNKLEKRKYWKLDFSQKLILTENEWVEKIITELRESVKLRMISDVPVGAYLSGGVDSSMIVSLMSQLSKSTIKTFTIGFKEKNMDESSYAKIISDQFNTDHHQIVVEKTSVEILPFLTHQMEEPFSDSSTIINYLIAKLASQHVKVVLNGDGGDENFAGYDRYSRLKRDAYLDNFRWILLTGYPLTSFLGSKISHFRRPAKFLKKMSMPLAERFATYNSMFLTEEKRPMYNIDFQDLTEGMNSYKIMGNFFKEANFPDVRDNGLYADIAMYLPEDLLVKTDLTSMSNSLEVRSPFLDQEFVDMCARIPFDLKIKNGQQKYILKKAAERIIPYDNVYRKKMGFSIPLKEWFSDGLDKFAHDKVFSKTAKLRSFLNLDEFEKQVKSNKNIDYGSRVWTLMTLELWLESYF